MTTNLHSVRSAAWERTRIWTWRVGVALYVAVAAIRAKIIFEGGTTTALTALQFGVILIVIATTVVLRRTGPLRRVDISLVCALAAFTVLQLATWPWSADVEASRSQALILLLMAGFLVVTYCLRWATVAAARGDLVFAFALVCVLQTIGLTAYLLGAEWASAGYGRFVGVYTNANFAGMVSAFVLPLSIYFVRFLKGSARGLVLAGSAVLLATLGLSLSRGAFVACTAGIVIALIFLVRKLWFTIGILVAGAITGGGLTLVLFALRNTAIDVTLDPAAADPSSGRLDLAAVLLESWSHSPIFGIGYRASTSVTDGLEAHNIYLSVLVETGIVGALAFAALIVSIGIAGPRRGISAIAAGGAVSVAVSETTESALFGWGAPSAIVAWIVVLAFAALGRLQLDSRPAPQLEDDGGSPRS